MFNAALSLIGGPRLKVYRFNCRSNKLPYELSSGL